MKFKLLHFYFLAFILLILNACANHSSSNLAYEQLASQEFCSDSFFEAEQKKMKKNSDVIYTGLNAGSIARNCQDFETSNDFFDRAEQAYKYDVDLENFAKKGAKAITTTLINEGIVDYQGSYYERIMVNIYKGLNFMSLKNYEYARVEFNRALMRQDKAKEYFAKQIKANRAEFDKAKRENDSKNINENYENISDQYENLLKDFSTTKDFVNPYATYVASLFFFLDSDFNKAADLFKEVAVINAKNAEVKKEFSVFNQYANSTNPNALKKYIFVIYENGLGAGLDEFSLSIPFIVNDNIITSTISLPVLKKRNSSFEYLNVNGQKTKFLVDFDNIIATEFKINMPATITKSLLSTIAKTSLNVAVANNDSTGGLLSIASSILTASVSKSDLRYWTTLPKYAQILMIENKGSIEITSPNNNLLYSNANLSKDKNLIIMLRSFSKSSPSQVLLIEK